MATTDASARPAASRPLASVRGRLRAGSVWTLVAVSVAVAALSLLFPSSPTYDPWAWIIWGREVLHLDLDTRFGPSWKPLPVLFTAPFALFGDAAPYLWLVVARAGSLLALLLAFRVARRLAGRGWTGIFGGAVAFAGLALSSDWVRNGMFGNSEGLLVALVLWAVDRHLDGARVQAFVLGFAAALLRPEVWPFLGVYGLWLWFRRPGSRPLVAGLLLAIPVLWFGPELWGSGDALRASSRARTPDLGTAAYATRPAFEVFETALGILALPLLLGFVLALVVAAVRRPRDRVVLGLGGIAVGWVAIVAAMTEVGYAGNPRYLVLAAALGCVLAGVGFAWVVRAAGRIPVRAAPVVTAAALVALCVPAGVEAWEGIGTDLEVVRNDALLAHELPDAVERSGGSEALLACARPVTGKYSVPLVAWELGLHVGEVAIHPSPPAVVFFARNAPPLSSPSRLPFTVLGETERWTVLAACGERPPATLD